MSKSNWGDLRDRVIWGLIMLAVGAVALWLGGYAFMALGAVVAGLMVWELVRMVRPGHGAAAQQMGCLAGVAVLASFFVPGGVAAILMALLMVVIVGRTGHRPILVALFTAGIFLGAYGLVQLRVTGGLWSALWLVAVVVVTDVAGYFAGRLIGGPKFWPRVSPKKTWSGTAAGWIGAAMVSAALAAYLSWSVPGTVLFGVLLSFASQMGDVAESALKRRVGVKDSSDLTPGHGGVMDRFDGMIGASLLVALAGIAGVGF